MKDSHGVQIQSRPIAGRLEGIGIPDLLWFLSEREQTGLLRVDCDGMESALYFEDGRVIFASSSDPDDQLGMHLLRQDLVTLDQLEKASSTLSPGRRLGRALMEAGILTPEQLVSGVLAQLKSIVLNLFSTLEGGYYFLEGSLPTDEAITLGIPVKALIIEGIKQVRSQSLLRRNVGGAGTVYGLARDWIEILDGLDLGEGEEQLVERLEDGDRTLELLCREVYLSSFEIYQILWAFKVLGVVEEKEASSAAQHGTYDRIPLVGENFIEFLLRLCRDAETGLLHANRGSLERSFFLQSGQCVFATSSDPDDGLVTFLLRNGVISLQDREETAKRLLTNKRVGTLLREMGAIDDDDLRDTLRQQLCEIVWDTFVWEDGEFGFVSGVLPSQEEITLDLNVESLVVSGLRRMTSWTRIEQGAGGLDSVLELTPDYLEILDATGAGTEEWEVTAALKSPKTLRELCRSSSISDFRIAQIVWGLKLLGGVEAISSGVSLDLEQNKEAITGEESAVRVNVVDLDRGTARESTAVELLEAGVHDPLESAASDDFSGDHFEEAESSVSAAEPDEVESIEADQQSATIAPREPGPEQTVSGVELEGDELERIADGEGVDIVAVQPDEEAEKAAQEAEPVDEPLSPAATSILSREAVKAALSANPEDAEPATSAAALHEEEQLSSQEILSPAETSVLSREAVQAALAKSTEHEEFAELPAGEDGGEAEELLSPAATSVLSRDVVEAALSDGVESEQLPLEEETEELEEPLSPAATSVLSREAVGALLSGEMQLEGTEQQLASATADAAEEELSEEESVEPAYLDPAATQVLDRENVQAALDRVAEGPTEDQAAEAAWTSDEYLDTGIAPAAGTDKAEPEATDQGVPFELSDPSEDEWELPEDLDEMIKRFNAAQRIIYRTVKTEIGAGAANFVRSCCGQAAEAGEHDWNQAELHTDGSWDTEGLKRVVLESRIADPWPAYLLVIEKEIDSLRMHIGEDRAAELRRTVIEEKI